MPEEIREWSYITKSNCKELNGLSSSFVCIKNDEENHGPVKVKSGLNILL